MEAGDESMEAGGRFLFSRKMQLFSSAKLLCSPRGAASTPANLPDGREPLRPDNSPVIHVREICPPKSKSPAGTKEPSRRPAGRDLVVRRDSSGARTPAARQPAGQRRRALATDSTTPPSQAGQRSECPMNISLLNHARLLPGRGASKAVSRSACHRTTRRPLCFCGLSLCELRVLRARQSRKPPARRADTPLATHRPAPSNFGLPR